MAFIGTIAQNVSRLQSAKALLKEAIEAKGVTVPSDAKLEEYAALVASIGE